MNRTNVLTNRARLLHLAPENIFQKNLSSLPHLHYVTGDLESPNVLVRMDITSIPFPADSFDAILCSHVLEHVPDDRCAIRELFRVLRPRGWAILHVPIDRTRARTFEDSTVVSPDDRARMFGQSDHVRVYGLDYQERLEAAGFEVVVDNFLVTLEKGDIGKYGLSDREDVYLCVKPERNMRRTGVA